MSIHDGQAAFYLRHREQLAEWFALRAEAAEAVDEWLTELKSELDALRAELGPGIELEDETAEGAWPGLFVFRNDWAPDRRNGPRVAIQWARGKTVLVGSNAPIIGVHAERAQPGGRALFESSDFQRLRRDRKDSNSLWWAAYRYVLPRQPFPEFADEYRMLLLNEIREAWRAYSLAIDAALAHHRPGETTDSRRNP